MSVSTAYLSASEAAARLGVSAKALRLYERRALLEPLRTAAGWRAYGPDQMIRAGEIAGLRSLGLSLAEVGRVLGGEAIGLGTALGAHEAAMAARRRELDALIARIREVRAGLAAGRIPTPRELAGLARPARPGLSLELPWPWNGERFELSAMRSLTWIVGSLGSGKTRLAMRMAEAARGGVFLGLDRLSEGEAAVQARFAADPELEAAVGAALAWLVDEGASASEALTGLIAAIEAKGPDLLVIDMVEEGLNEASQEALAAWLRRRGPDRAPLALMTRSSSMLDLAAVGPDEAIIHCPANHSLPMLVEPAPGTPGYEALRLCLATPDVRARVAMRPHVA